MRADVFLFNIGIAKSRSHAQTLISGGVLIGGRKIEKPSADVQKNSVIRFGLRPGSGFPSGGLVIPDSSDPVPKNVLFSEAGPDGYCFTRSR